MPADCVSAGTANDGAQNQAHQDGVVRIAEHRDEIRDEVEGQGEIGEEQPEPDAHAARKLAVDRQAPQELQRVRQQPQRLAQERSFGLRLPEDEDEERPTEQDSRGDSNEDSEHHGAFVSGPWGGPALTKYNASPGGAPEKIVEEIPAAAGQCRRRGCCPSRASPGFCGSLRSGIAAGAGPSEFTAVRRRSRGGLSSERYYSCPRAMCLAVYIASPSPLPLVAWREEDPAFYVQDAELDDPVRAHFGWANVYYVGSHEGCGCGFAYNQLPKHLQESGDEAQRRSSVAALRDYVREATALGPVQLFACWEGEQSFPEKDRVAASPDALGGDAFDFEQLRMMEFPARGPHDRAETGKQNGER